MAGTNESRGFEGKVAFVVVADVSEQGNQETARMIEEQARARRPVGRLGKPEVVGHALVIDGGQTVQ
jgi:hypothetical protein